MEFDYLEPMFLQRTVPGIQLSRHSAPYLQQAQHHEPGKEVCHTDVLLDDRLVISLGPEEERTLIQVVAGNLGIRQKLLLLSAEPSRRPIFQALQQEREVVCPGYRLSLLKLLKHSQRQDA